MDKQRRRIRHAAAAAAVRLAGRSLFEHTALASSSNLCADDGGTFVIALINFHRSTSGARRGRERAPRAQASRGTGGRKL